MFKLLILGIIISYVTMLPLVIKWELDKKQAIPFLGLAGLISGFIVYLIDMKQEFSFILNLVFIFLLIFLSSFSALLWRFFRDPDRKITFDENAILSPADGTIIYIKRIEKNKVPLSEKKGKTYSLERLTGSNEIPVSGYLIGIAMSFLDVHINRAPIKGNINKLHYIKGLFISLKHKKAVIENERVYTLFETNDLKIGVVQIASRLVRKIVPFVEQGDKVDQGQRFGVIKFGSQVDVIIPDVEGLKICVTEKQYVNAGLSKIAELINK